MAGLVPFNKKHSNDLITGFDDFGNMFDDFFADTWPFRRNFFSNTFKVDVQEKDSNYLVEAELPGVKKGDVSIDFDEGRLKISVRQCEDVDEKKKNYIHKERRCSSIARSIYLEDAKAEGITAKLDEGVLSVTVPKQQKPDTSKRIEIE